MEYATSIQYNSEYRKVELESSDMLGCDTASEEGSERELCFSSCREEDATSEISVDGDSEDEIMGDKYLIFTTGYKTYTPHQIGNLIEYIFLNISANFHY